VDELVRISDDLDAPLLRAMVAHATGTVALEAGDVEVALEAFRAAVTRWRQLEAPYEHARSRAGFGLACRVLGDETTAQLELGAARDVLEDLGATPEAERVGRRLGARPGRSGDGSGLTPRQIEVLALVAAGHTNRDIAAALVVSEHTVRRHLQNIFTRLGVTSRAAAAAYAVKRGLV